MARRVVETKAVSHDRELLQVVVIFEEGAKKQDIRKENRLTKRHGVIYKSVLVGMSLSNQNLYCVS